MTERQIKVKAGFPAVMESLPFSLPSRVWRHNQQRPGGTATIRPSELMVRNWQASEKDYLGLKGLTSLLDNGLGLKMMTLQSHHLRAKKKVQVLLRGSEITQITLIFTSLEEWRRTVLPKLHRDDIQA